MYDIFMRWFSLATPSVKQNRLQASITSDVSPDKLHKSMEQNHRTATVVHGLHIYKINPSPKEAEEQ